MHPKTADTEITAKELIINIKDWFFYLLPKWWLILLLGIVGAFVGLMYASSKRPLYTATTTFVLEGADGKGGLSQYAGVAAMVGIDLGGAASGLFQGDNILELYKSRRMLSQALLTKVHPDSTELLIERYINYNGLREGWSEKPELLALDFSQNPKTLSAESLRGRDSLLTQFVNSINKNLLRVEKPDQKLSIITVEVTSPDEVFSKTFNENLVRQVNEFYIQTKTKKSVDNIAILEDKVDSVRSVMMGAIYSAARASDETPNLNPTRQVQRIAPTQEAQFSAEANRLILSQLIQNLELTKMALLQEQPLIQLIDQPVYPLKRDQLRKSKGIVMGGFFFGLITALFLMVQRWYRRVIA